jgi:hypothetical protein
MLQVKFKKEKPVSATKGKGEDKVDCQFQYSTDVNPHSTPLPPNAKILGVGGSLKPLGPILVPRHLSTIESILRFR